MKIYYYLLMIPVILFFITYIFSIPLLKDHKKGEFIYDTIKRMAKEGNEKARKALFIARIGYISLAIAFMYFFFIIATANYY